MSAVTPDIIVIGTPRLPHWSDFRRMFLEWRQHAYSRRELMTLSDHELSDIGLTRMNARNEISKTFWRR